MQRPCPPPHCPQRPCSAPVLLIQNACNALAVHMHAFDPHCMQHPCVAAQLFSRAEHALYRMVSQLPLLQGVAGLCGCVYDHHVSVPAVSALCACIRGKYGLLFRGQSSSQAPGLKAFLHLQFVNYACCGCSFDQDMRTALHVTHVHGSQRSTWVIKGYNGGYLLRSCNLVAASPASAMEVISCHPARLFA
eukprot:1142473-Pelagomonas_calceolata.AAC.18